MKPLTPAQQRVVDVMKDVAIMRMSIIQGWFEYVDKCGHIPTNVANALVRKGVLIQSGESQTCYYYTLSPEYK